MTKTENSNALLTLNDGGGRESVFAGRAVSRGIAAGPALCLHGRKRQFYRAEIASDRIDEEIARFRDAVARAKHQLRQIIEGSDPRIGEKQVRIFETHTLFLEDGSLLKGIESMIAEDRINAEWAVKQVSDQYVARYKSLSDKHLREKYIDLEDVAERIVAGLGNGSDAELDFEAETIIVAAELNPSTLIELMACKPGAIVTETGGWTSHTFILARELEIPAVTGVRHALRLFESGDDLLVDGYTGKVVLNPTPEMKDGVGGEPPGSSVRAEEESSQQELKTLDGLEINIRANLDISRDYETAKRSGARGIGLYRSEFLFSRSRGFPPEEEQYRVYKAIVDEVGDEAVHIRTFDLDSDDVVSEISSAEKNPALGLRAIRLSMKYEVEFRRQIRALLRASEESAIGIVLPMISDVWEIEWARDVISDELESLEKLGIAAGRPSLGAMIEVPAAVLSIGDILGHVDFINIGTNDLVQYVLAADRDNEAVGDWFRTLHPAVLESLRIVFSAAKRVGKPVIVCGEMAASPLYVPLLIALGAVDLSMNVNSIGKIRHLISCVAREECVEALDEIGELRSNGEIDALVLKAFHRKWGKLVDFEDLISFSRA